MRTAAEIRGSAVFLDDLFYPGNERVEYHAVLLDDRHACKIDVPRFRILFVSHDPAFHFIELAAQILQHLEARFFIYFVDV